MQILYKKPCEQNSEGSNPFVDATLNKFEQFLQGFKILFSSRIDDKLGNDSRGDESGVESVELVIELQRERLKDVEKWSLNDMRIKLWQIGVLDLKVEASKLQ